MKGLLRSFKSTDITVDIKNVIAETVELKVTHAFWLASADMSQDCCFPPLYAAKIDPASLPFKKRCVKSHMFDSKTHKCP